ncbi:MAG: tripartite tricarboxylate transporter permease [Hyphomicrobiaceae bacterium]
MDLLSNLALGFSVAFTFENLMFCLIGAVLGTLIGVLPGIGPVPTIAMLLPFTFSLSPIPALIMMAGIYYGAQYGGSTTAILVNMPGESSSVVTCLDGYQMARQGRAGAALAIAAIGSFIAGTIATILIAVCAGWMTLVTQSFGAAEYFSLMVFGLIAAVVLAQGSILKAVAMIIVGLFLGLIGTDVNTGKQRYTFGIPELSDGIGFVPIALGIFGIAEIVHNLSQKEDRSILAQRITGLMPTAADMRASLPAIFRGTAIGSLLGVLPGGGAVLSAFSAYTLEKKISRTPERFGNGAIEGVAAPEAANNAGAQTSFIPLLMLGIPPNAVMALMVGAMMIHGIQPGPQVMTKQPDLFWGLIASMWLGNLMLLVINLPMIGIWVRLLSVPYNLLSPAILLFCCIGVYSLNNSGFEVALTAVFGILGYFFLKAGCEGAPLLLGFVLGPLMEENLRRALLLSQGDPTVFVTRPISAVLLALAAMLLVIVVLPAVRATREVAFKEAS